MFKTNKPIKVKVSEYPFKKNRNMLKNMTMLLYTIFFNISLNVLKPTFFDICNLPFYALHISVKLGLKLGQKLTTFPTL